MSMRAKRGSIGSRAISRPSLVSRREAVTARSSVSSSNAALTPRLSGMVRNGNSSMSPKPSASICRITDASEVRRISGSVYSGRARKSSSPYSRIAMPSEVRPARPERCCADACEMASIGRRCTLDRTL